MNSGRIVRAIATLLMASVLVACGSGGGNAGSAVPTSSTAVAVTASPAPTTAPSATARPSTPASPASGVLYDPTADATADIAAAMALAKADGKRVLLDFGADWCPDCHVLAAYVHGPAGSRLVDSAYHVVPVDVGVFDHNLDVAATYGNPIANGIPAVVVLGADGTVIGSTGNGSLANARTMSESDVLAILARWAS